VISFSWPPVYGGSGTQAQRLAPYLIRRGVSVTALTARHDAALAAREEIDGVRVIRLPVAGIPRVRAAGFFVSAAAQLVRHAKIFDVIHVLGAYFRVAPIVAAARILGKPVVVKMTSLGTDDPSSSRRRRLGSVLLWALRRADAVISVSEDMSEAYRRSGLPLPKLFDIPNGVETGVFAPSTPEEKRVLREQLGLPLDGEIVVFVGPVRYRKGIDTLVAAWPDVLSRRAKASLVLVGPIVEDAPAGLPSVASLLSTAKNTSIRGKCDDVERYLRAADLFALPTRLEGSPNALLEAMACGLACAAGRVPGTEALVESDRSGSLFEPGDAVGLADTIVGLLEDPVRRRDLGERARQRIVDKYSMDSVADAYAALYRRLLETPRSGSPD
jgi:glycosyltransferase involved in cell wall biosynthesis